MAQLSAHTSRVLLLRWILPIFAVITLIGVVAWPTFKEMQLVKLSANSATALKIKDVSMSLPKEGQEMELQVSKPEYSGMDDKNNPYMVTADRVIQKGLKLGSPMTLEKPVATVTLNTATQERLQVDGKSGVYDPTNKTLELDGPVTVTHTQGYVINLQELHANITKGELISNHPVNGNGPGGSLEGESLEIRDRGNEIILKGRSKVVLVPKADAPEKEMKEN